MDREESWLIRPGDFLAASADFLFKLVEQGSVMFAHDIEQTGKQKIAGRIGAGQKASD